MAHAPRPPAGILLDLDDTIIDFTAAEASCAQFACQEAATRGVAIAVGQFRQIIDQQMRRRWSDPAWARRSTGGRTDTGSVARAIFAAALAQAGIDDLGVAERLTERYRVLRFAEMRLFPGAIDTLSHLRGHGIRLALVTNGSTASQRMKIERFGLAPCFDHILIDSEFGVGKPDPRIYEAALKALGCSPAAAWMVGDDLYNDVAAPQQLGIAGVWVDARGVGLAPDAPAKPDYVVRSIQEIGPHLAHPLRLVDYDARWPELFMTERQRLQTALGPLALEIQHTGSTAVSGLAAKPVIDITVGIREYPLPNMLIEAVVALGYEHKGEYGLPRHHFFRKGVPPTHHIRVFELDSTHYQSHILFRDYLRDHPDAARQYEALKRDLARSFQNDRRAYQDGKAGFIEDIISRARRSA